MRKNAGGRPRRAVRLRCRRRNAASPPGRRGRAAAGRRRAGAAAARALRDRRHRRDGRRRDRAAPRGRPLRRSRRRPLVRRRAHARSPGGHRRPAPPGRRGTGGRAGPGDADGGRARREQETWRAGVRRSNNGFLRAEILPGNVGYLDYRRFQPPDLSGDTLVAAMAFFANVDALIFDLRNCRGGQRPHDTVRRRLLLRPLDPPSQHGVPRRQLDRAVLDQPWVPGKRLATTPLYITTSAFTFSARRRWPTGSRP